MKINERSTSPLMRNLFGKDLNIVLQDYTACISELMLGYPELRDMLEACINRTGFLFPYMSAEYGWYSIKGYFIPSELKDIVLAFGLLGLVAAVDDDTVDEFRTDHLRAIRNICVSELLQNVAYFKLFRNAEKSEAHIAVEEISNALNFLIKYQFLDALNIKNFSENDFDLHQYLKATYKTVCPIKFGLRLGLRLARAKENYIQTAEKIAVNLGMSLQLIDDILDLKDDIRNYKKPVTYPMWLLSQNRDLNEIFSLIHKKLEESLSLSKIFPYHSKIEQVIKGFKKVLENVRNIKLSIDL